MGSNRYGRGLSTGLAKHKRKFDQAFWQRYRQQERRLVQEETNYHHNLAPWEKTRGEGFPDDACRDPDCERCG